MEIWIRTQNKEMLTKIEDVSFIKDSQTDDYVILTTKTSVPAWHHLHFGGATILGVYKTKEKALQVLDEIQNLLVQPTAFLKADILQGMSLEDAKKCIRHVNKFCRQNNLTYIGSKDIEVIPSNNANIVYTMPKELANEQ